MNGVLLDTCTCIELFRSNKNVLGMLNSFNPNECYVSEIVVAELFLITDNIKHMSRINQIEIENWR